MSRPGLTDIELRHLAFRHVARHVGFPEAWLHWEDFPEMTEDEFGRFSDQIRQVAGVIAKWSRNLDWGADIDSLELLERVQ